MSTGCSARIPLTSESCRSWRTSSGSLTLSPPDPLRLSRWTRPSAGRPLIRSCATSSGSTPVRGRGGLPASQWTWCLAVQMFGTHSTNRITLIGRGSAKRSNRCTRAQVGSPSSLLTPFYSALLLYSQVRVPDGTFLASVIRVLPPSRFDLLRFGPRLPPKTDLEREWCCEGSCMLSPPSSMARPEQRRQNLKSLRNVPAVLQLFA